MADEELCDRTARELASLARSGQASARELVEAHLGRIERLNGRLNAVVTVTAERAWERAAWLDEQMATVGPVGELHGLPVAHKDLLETAGVRTTFGSTLYAQNLPGTDHLVVERVRRAGAVMLGKTNTPEFGCGSQTHNRLFGATLNPYDTSRTCGGSSGGSAVALATGMVALADGSDMGGSLRNPASFCNVVGLRPSPGRVPDVPSRRAWFDLSVLGPMGRTVGDAALLLGVMAGPDLRAPRSLPEPGALFQGSLEADCAGVRVAFGGDLGGLCFQREVLAAFSPLRSVFEELGCDVEDAEPDLGGAETVFRVLRGWHLATTLADDVARGGEAVSPMVRENVAWGQAVTAQQLAWACERRSAIAQRVGDFLTRHQFLVLPVSQVLPFPVEQPWVAEIEGTAMPDYLGWMASCYYVSVLALPAASVPAGFSAEGLPFGVQIVGRPGDDLGVLRLAHAFEQATLAGLRRPAL
ncbi:MAG: amidase [Acidimicrobiales bacterium]